MTRNVVLPAAALALFTVAPLWHPWRCTHGGVTRRDGVSQGAIPITGGVRSLLGRPIAGVAISARKLDPAGSLASLPPTSTSTDAHGIYRLELGDSDYVVEASLSGFATGSAYVVADGSNAREVDLTLAPAASVSGQVLDVPAGKGVSGATVTASGELEIGSVTAALKPVTALTGADGSFTLRGLRPGTIRLTASRNDLATRQPTIVPLAVGDELWGVEVWVDVAFSVSGSVTNRWDNSRPVAGIWVRARDSGTRESISALRPSRNDGHFEIEGLRPGSYVLYAQREGMSPQETGVSVVVSDANVADRRVAVDPEALNVPLAPLVDKGSIFRHGIGACGGIVTGAVTDAEGTPARGVWVTANREDLPPGTPGGWSALTGTDGQFALKGLCRESYRVSAHALATTGRATKTPVQIGDRVSLVLGKPSTLTGSVWYKGEPVTHYVCILTGPVSRRERIEDGDGNYRLPWLDPGHYELIVEAGEGHSATSIELLPDTVEQLKVVLSPWPAGSDHPLDERRDRQSQNVPKNR